MEARDFSALRISLASPEEIQRWSYGEVTKPETINYRRLRPEKDGLFCEAIFGPTKDWQCYCGKYKNVRHRGVICDKCGVQVTRSSVRRERMGHIELAAPVAHVWYTRRVPSHLGLLLDVNRKNLDRVLYFAQYVITQMDEDARQKALKRLDKELAEREQEVCAEIEEQIDELRAAQAAEAARLVSEREELLSAIAADLNSKTEALMREAQAAQSQIEDSMDVPTRAAIRLDSLDLEIVKKGAEPKNQHISLIQEAVAERLRQLQAENETERQRQLAELAHPAAAGIDSELEAELSAQIEALHVEAEETRAIINKRMGEKAEASIKLDSQKKYIITKGNIIKELHLQRIEDAVEERQQALHSAKEKRRETRLEELANAQVNESVDYRAQIAELERLCDEKRRLIRQSADRTREELLWFQPVDFRRPPQFLTENRYRELKGRYGQVFSAHMGAEAFQILLQRLDLDGLSTHLWEEMRTTRSKQKRDKAVKRLRVVERLRKSGNKPEWMILTMLPVIPPDLRPMVQLDGGRFATSDMNDLYRRVINRNKRLKHLLNLGAPDVIVRNEKRMLQEAVDSLIDNSQRGKALSRRGRRELKSLSDMLKGKKGRFRRNLLGKRVDYSGRSVIVIGPKLKLHECGLPKTMALELFRPFVISRLVQHNYASNVKGAKRIIERERSEVWEVLEEVIKERPVFLNRAPTLHRLGIQAFEPKLVEGDAIQIHPLVCSAFNADFDGDQMAVHVPLSERAVRETRELMLSTRNLLKPADGSPIVGPSKDMVLGIYYLTMDPTVDIVTRSERADDFRCIATVHDTKVKVGIAHSSNGYYFSEREEIPGRVIYQDIVEEDERGRSRISEGAIDRTVRALREGEVDCLLANGHEALIQYAPLFESGELVISNLHERRSVVDIDEVMMLYNIGQVGLHTPILLGNPYERKVSDTAPQITTVGRAIFNSILPDDLRFQNEKFTKDGLQNLVAECYQKIGSEQTTQVIDEIKNLGFQYATISGTTVAIADLTIPKERDKILGSAQVAVDDASRDYRRGLLTEDERYQITIERWNEAKNQLQSIIGDAIDPYGPIAIMALSGSSKGGFGPITQMAGMRGLMADPSGRIIDLPIKSNFRSGLTPLEYFISTHGSRKGLTDTALRTADAGYLTRRLVDVAQDVIVNRWDCGTSECAKIRTSDDIAGQKLNERIVGRCASEDILHPDDGTLIAARNDLIDEEIAQEIVEAKVEIVPVRSPLTCGLTHGICALCYGRDLGRGEMVEIGEAVGIVAAQSIGEPGTQLTLRTFQTGGTAGPVDITSGLPRVEELFEARTRPKGEAIMAEIGGRVRLTREEGVRRITIIDSQVRNEEFPLGDGWELLVSEGASVQDGTEVVRNLETNELLVASGEGEASIEDDRLYLRYEQIDERVYDLPASAIIMGDIVDGGQVIAGQQLTEGSKNPHLVLRVQGRDAAQMYLLVEMQKVYRSQGVIIADKHFEIIIRKMFSKVRILDSGDSKLLPGDVVERLVLLDTNDKLVEEGLEPAISEPLLLRITQSALETESFLSAASFQHTIKELARAAVEGAEDRLCGLKENVIIGKLIPAGTGFHTYQHRDLGADVDDYDELIPELGSEEVEFVLEGDAHTTDSEELTIADVDGIGSLPEPSSDN